MSATFLANTSTSLFPSIKPSSLFHQFSHSVSVKMVDYKGTVAELQEILKSRGLPTSGKKADLIARLQEADKAAEENGTPKTLHSIAALTNISVQKPKKPHPLPQHPHHQPKHPPNPHQRQPNPHQPQQQPPRNPQ
jgi:hypothetical protein